MTPTERLEAAAAKLETVRPDATTYSWFDDDWMTTCSWGPVQSHALAALLREIARPDSLDLHIQQRALDVAGSVGVSDKEAGNE